MTSTCLRRWCAGESGLIMAGPEIFAAFALTLPRLHLATIRPIQSIQMIKKFYLASLAIILLLTSFGAIYGQTPQRQSGAAPQVTLDIPSIAERVNQVVVNVRSNYEGGENVGSG